ncbi:MAG: DinB family protein [Chitinophagaceae bacterium]|nr:DinB family protein [Chitinophagaceae bacterium]MCW5928675.1 DinB family protein [Chitinophagaceae bacterium]
MDTPLSTQLNIIIPAFRGHTQNFLMVLEDISEKDALKRIEGRTNHIVWMAGNFVNMRYALAGVLGIPGKDPHEDIFFRAKALDESFSYPSLAELKENFHKISPILYQRLLTTTDEELKKPFPIGMNMSFFPETILNFVGMCIGREDYLCGQMGLMRRILNYPGMKYEVNENIKY